MSTRCVRVLVGILYAFLYVYVCVWRIFFFSHFFVDNTWNMGTRCTHDALRPRPTERIVDDAALHFSPAIPVVAFSRCVLVPSPRTQSVEISLERFGCVQRLQLLRRMARSKCGSGGFSLFSSTLRFWRPFQRCEEPLERVRESTLQGGDNGRGGEG